MKKINHFLKTWIILFIHPKKMQKQLGIIYGGFRCNIMNICNKKTCQHDA